MKRLWIGLLIGLALPFQAKAEVQDCSKALVPATVVSNTIEITNLSIAWSLSREAYEEAKKGGGISTKIFGVPVGANYEDFRHNVQSEAEKLNIQNFALRAIAFATSGIDTNSLEAYKACLLKNGGISVVAGAMGVDSYVVWVIYNAGAVPNPNTRGHVVSTGNLLSKSDNLLRKEISHTDFTRNVDAQFVINPENIRKEGSVTIGVSAGGTGVPLSAALLLPPLSVPQQPVTKICRVIFHSNDNDAQNFTLPMPPSSHTHECARLAQKYMPNATDVRVGCRVGDAAEGHDRVGEQRFAITPGHGYDPNLHAAAPPFGPDPNCGWD